MSFQESLGPRMLGAEVLVRVAQKRFNGKLKWLDSNSSAGLVFVGGRPQLLIDASGDECKEREELEQALQSFSITSIGTCTFEEKELSEVAHHEALRIDTLAVVLNSLLTNLRSAQIESFFGARMRYVVSPTRLFNRLAVTVSQLSGVYVERPQERQTIGQLMFGGSIERQRAWVTLLVLGGLEVVEMPAPRGLEEVAKGCDPQEVEALSEAEMARRRLIDDLGDAHARIKGMSHYELLGVDREASAGAINAAFLEKAKLWHSEQYVGVELGEAKVLLEDLFSSAEKAYQILSDQQERQAYDLIQDRLDKGLPVDPRIIAKAEELFRRAQIMVRRGNASEAEPLLREAVELNSGEPEFWAYLGFSIYTLGGNDRLEEALSALENAKNEDGDLDCIYEFLGRIAYAEGNFSEAHEKLTKAIEMNPTNRNALEELRQIKMHSEEEPLVEGALTKVIRGLLGRRKSN